MLTVACGAPVPDGPELILTGGRIYLGPRGDEVVSALAIDGNAIAALGDDATIRTMATAATQEMPLGGATVLAGMHDAWIDLFALGAIDDHIDLRLTASPRDIQAKIRAELGSRDGTIVGWGWDERRWPDPTPPTTQALDDVTLDVPVVLFRRDGRVAWLNSAALRATGLTDRRVVIDGAATGLVTGIAVDTVERVLLADSGTVGAERLRRALRAAAAAGITSLATAPLRQPELDVLAAMDPADFTLRIEARLAPGAVAPAARGLLRFRAIGVVLDGPIPLLEAALEQPVVGQSDTPPAPDAAVAAACAAAETLGLPLDVYARGDAGVMAATACRVLGAIVGADVLPDTGSLPPGTRLIAVPGRFGHDMYWLDDLLGPERRPRVHAYRAMARNGWLAGIASDAPANEVGPMEALRIMFTRRDREGFPLDGWQPQERLAVSDSLAAMMASSPLGADLRAGRPADLVVWSEDPYAGEAELSRALAMLVLVEGRVVYSRPLVTPPMDRRQHP
jgi:hypothetical protein